MDIVERNVYSNINIRPFDMVLKEFEAPRKRVDIDKNTDGEYRLRFYLEDHETECLILDRQARDRYLAKILGLGYCHVITITYPLAQKYARRSGPLSGQI